jgi:branched-chain amino acid transport system permease protein
MRTGSMSTVTKSEKVRTRFAVVRETRASTIARILAVSAIVILFALPAFASRVLLQELFYVFTMLSLAQLWNLLAGSAGLISVGQQAFVGVGAYALFAFTVIAGLDAVLSIVLSGALAGLVAVPAALIVFRLRGAYLRRHVGGRRSLPLVLAQVKQ